MKRDGALPKDNHFFLYSEHFDKSCFERAFSKSTVHRPTDHRPPSHRPTVHRPPTHRPPSHRPKIYFKDQISLISENWTSAARMQLKLCRMYPYRLQFIFLKSISKNDHAQ